MTTLEAPPDLDLNQIAAMPDDSAIDLRAFAALAGVCAKTVRRAMGSSGFPRPLALNRRVLRFRLGDVRRWLRGADRAAERLA